MREYSLWNISAITKRTFETFALNRSIRTSMVVIGKKSVGTIVQRKPLIFCKLLISINKYFWINKQEIIDNNKN